MSEALSTGHVQAQLTAQRTAYTNGVLAIFTGLQPASADAAETGNLICLITVGSGAFVAGQPGNGLNFDAPVAGVMSKAEAETWSGVGTALAGAGGSTAGWFRFYANDYTTGVSTTAKRFDGAISASSTAELQMSVTTIVTGSPVVINSFNYTPARV